MTASGQRFSEAFWNNSASSCVIFTFTCTVRFIPSCMSDPRTGDNVTNSTVSTLPCYDRRVFQEEHGHAHDAP